LNYLLCINDATDTLCADFEEGATGATPGLNHPISGVTPIANGSWYHAAVTYDGTTWRLYLNGVLENQAVVNQPVNAANISATSLATMLTTTNTANGFFNGALDEVRIWNYSRTESEIRSTLNTEITSPQTGLVARWGLNEGSGNVVGATAGTTINGSVTGAGYSWITPGAPFNVTFNAPPNAPILVTPPDNSTNVPTSPTLSVDVSDPDGGNLTVQFYGRPVNTATGPDFSIIAIPDTQFYTSSMNGGSPAIMASQTDWIVNNIAANNIKFVTQLGDCTQNGNVPAEWLNADLAFQTIEDVLATGMPYGMPYGIAPGNHDQSPIGNPAGTAAYNATFGTPRFLGRDYYGGHYGSDNDNHYELFSASGIDFIVVHLEYDTSANAAVLAWADNLLQTYSTRRAVIVTHWLINAGFNASFSAQGQAIYDTLKDNPNLFLMLGGHVSPPEGQRSDTFNGNTVYSLMSDYQGRAAGGNGWLRIITISPSNNNIQIRTYSPWLNQYETDADSQFTLPVNLTNSFQLIGTDTVASGGTASVTWPGLNNDTEYEWYAVSSDGAASTTSSTWSFTTEPPANVPPTITGQNPLATNEDTSLDITLADLTVTDPDNTYPNGFSLAVQTGANYTVAGSTITPALNFNGALTVPVIVNDGTDNSNVFNLTVNVNPVNDVPTTTGITNVTVAEDAPNTTIDLWTSFADVETPDNLLTYTVSTNTNPALFTSVTVTAGQNLVLDYAPNTFGGAQVTVRATDAGIPSQFIETTFTVTVTPVNDAPTTTGIANRTVNEDAPDSIIDLWPSFADIENADNLLVYSVTANTTPALFTSVTVSGGQNLVLDYAPNLNGSSQITVRATDLNAAFVETTFIVTVTPVNDAPACANVLAATSEDTAVQNDPSCLDIDGDLLTYSIVAQPLNGNASVVADKLVYTPNANYNGLDSYTYRANDGTVNSNTATVNITVAATNDGPVANPQILTTAEDTALNLTLTGSDLENDPLTFAVFTPPTNGNLSGTAPNLTYTPNTNYNGPDSFTFRVNDGTVNSLIATISITVTPVNDVPVSVGESYTIAEDTDLNIAAPGILGNDTDLDANPLTAVLVTGPSNGSLTLNSNGSFTYTPNSFYNGLDSFTYRANDGIANGNIATVNINVSSVNNAPVCVDVALTTNEDTTGQTAPSCLDADGNTMTYSIVTQPTNGSASILVGQLVYVPNGNFNGVDSFTYRASDGVLNSNISTAVVTVVAVNDAPVATPQAVTTAEDTSVNITLSGSDIEGNALTFAITVPPTNGTLSGTDPNITYTPNANFNGVDSFSFTANDALLNSAPAIVTINVTAANDAPVATPQTVTTAEDAALAITLAGSDADANPLTFSTVTPPANGALSGTAPNLIYTPNANYNGPDAFTFLVNDGVADSALATVSITVAAANDEPTFTSTSVTSATEDNPYIYNITTFDADLGDILSITSPTLPSWLTLTDIGDGTATLGGTPLNANIGVNNVTLRVNDGTVNVDQVFTITVANTNDAPTDIALSKNTIDEGQPVGSLVGTLSTTDQDAGDTFTYSFCAAPDNASFIIVGNALQTDIVLDADVQTMFVICIHSQDAAGLFFEEQFTITLSNVNEAPLINLQSVAKSVDESALLFFNTINTSAISVSDPDAGAANLQMILSVSQGTLTLGSTAGLTITPPADGSGDSSITFAGSIASINAALNNMRYNPVAGYNGTDQLQITVDDLGNTGSGGAKTANAAMDLSILAMPPKIVANGINSIADTGDGILSESEIVSVGITQFIVTFDQDVSDPAGDTDLADVTNPANYMLVHDNGNDFQTTSCSTGVSTQDVSININSVTYQNNFGNGPYVATLNVNDGLPLAFGNYRLFICGTTSITDLYGLELAGDGTNSGTDMIRTFTVVNGIIGGGGGVSTNENVTTRLTGVLIPVTGFTPNTVSVLPVQSEEDSYSAVNDLRLEIPSLSYNEPIVGIQFKNKTWDVKWLENQIGYLEGSAYPTWMGNSVMTGHATDANGNVTSFGYIRELKVGDKIKIHSNGMIYVYQVKENRLILPSSIKTLFKHEDYSWITLVTCENFNADLGKFISRRMVRAVLISVIPEK